MKTFFLKIKLIFVFIILLFLTYFQNFFYSKAEDNVNIKKNNEMKSAIQKRVEENRKLLKLLVHSNFKIINGRVLQIEKRPISTEEKDDLKWLQLATDTAIQRGFKIHEGAKIIIHRDQNLGILLIEAPPLPSMTRGPDYTAKIRINLTTGEVLETLHGN